MKKFLLAIVLMLSCCDSTTKPSIDNATFEKLSLEVFARAMEPYVIGGEDDTRLWVKVKSTAKDFGDREFSKKLRLLPPKRQGAFKFFLSRQFLNSLGYRETIIILSSNDCTNYPAAKAAKVAFDKSAEEFFAIRGW